MRRYVLLMNGWMEKRGKDILLSTLDRRKSWWKNTALVAIRAVVKYDYRFAAGVVMWALKRRWHLFKMRWPVYQELHKWQNAYWDMHDQWSASDLEYRSLYVKHLDLIDEVKYWEQRHAKIMNYVEKKMELDDQWGKP